MPRFASVFETWQAGASQILGRTHQCGDGVMNFLFVRNRFAMASMPGMPAGVLHRIHRWQLTVSRTTAGSNKSGHFKSGDIIRGDTP